MLKKFSNGKINAIFQICEHCPKLFVDYIEQRDNGYLNLELLYSRRANVSQVTKETF